MRFHFSARTTLVLLPLAAVFTWLGAWQLQRMQEKQGLMASFEQAPRRAYIAALERGESFARIRLKGAYDQAWHVLRDNRIENGRAGVHVFSLFRPDPGPAILVNRGWLPMAPDRRTLPAVPTPSQRIEISGMLAPPPDPGVRIGEADDLDMLSGPVLVTYLELEQLADAAAIELPRSIILLDPDDATGFGARAWQPAVMLPSQHRGYAFQWFALAAAAIIIWIALAARQGTRGNGRSRGARDRSDA